MEAWVTWKTKPKGKLKRPPLKGNEELQGMCVKLRGVVKPPST
jgi:hypothetical protein